MVRSALGVAALAVALAAGPANAGPSEADLWIGFDGSSNGFLLNTENGDLWMTGICLKPLETAINTGDVWVSRTAELVSVGRAMAMLDQTFTLDLVSPTPQITVSNSNRGGLQTFDAVVEPACQASTTCRALTLQPVCED